jgi:signal peptidase I
MSDAAGARAARPRRRTTLSPLVRECLSLLAKVAAIVAVGAFILAFVCGVARSTGADMAPAMQDGDIALVYRLDKGYEAGDICALSFEGVPQLRRVAAIAGDTVDITEDGLYINGALQQEPAVDIKTVRYDSSVVFPLTLKDGEVFVLGDARDGATDSRIYGPVAVKDTLGKMIALIRHREL